MAFQYSAVAVRWSGGRHEVVAERVIGTGIDWAGIEKEFPLYDVSDNVTGYVDRATLLPVHRFREFIQSPAVVEWLEGEAGEATFILLHVAEWESGMGD